MITYELEIALSVPKTLGICSVLIAFYFTTEHKLVNRKKNHTRLPNFEVAYVKFDLGLEKWRNIFIIRLLSCLLLPSLMSSCNRKVASIFIKSLKSNSNKISNNLVSIRAYNAGYRSCRLISVVISNVLPLYISRGNILLAIQEVGSLSGSFLGLVTHSPS